MDEKLLITVRADADAERVRQSGAVILAAYPQSVLVRATAYQRAALQRGGLEPVSLSQAPIRPSGSAFDFASALAAKVAAPTAHDPSRAAAYLIRAIGPIRGEWLSELRANGATVHASLPGFILLVGLRQVRSAAIRALVWVEAITPYRAGMKVSARLRTDTHRTLGTHDLTTAGVAADDREGDEQVEISVFPGESTADIAALIRTEGGVVLGETPQEVIAVVTRGSIARLADEPAVQAILPYAPPALMNDRAAPVLGIPADRQFGEVTLTGAGQIVAVADSGLDTGDLASLHLDLRNRVVDVVRCQIKPGYLEYIDGPGLLHDGIGDIGSGHGTHVAGSVLGNGSAATTRGASIVPRGIAPDAQLYFQAMEKGVRWKSSETLAREGRRPFQRNWPPTRFGLHATPDDLNELFEQAYAAGARIHTNSWGTSRSEVLGSYNAMARAVDVFLWSHRDMLILFAAGSGGSDTDQRGQIGDTVDPDVVGPPGTAKNCLTIGASESRLGGSDGREQRVERGLSFGQHSFTDDRRIKPDVVAPGTNILSARSSVHDNPDVPTILGGDLPTDHPLHGLYCWSSGASMATPLVAGAAALVRQYLVQERGHILGGSKPSGALLKALLVNGATPMMGQTTTEALPEPAVAEAPPGPSPAAGFGLVNVTAALGLDGAPPVFFSDETDLALESGETRTIELEVVVPGQPLKVTLVWTDAPSLAHLAGLQNALYLQVCEPDGTILNGDVTPYPTATNNVQQVTIPAPVAGTYEVRVRGVSVIMALPGTAPGETPRQDFALAASNAREAGGQGRSRVLHIPPADTKST